MARNGTIADRMNRARSSLLVVACMVLSIALCAWGTIGWRRAYRAQAEFENLAWAEQLRDAQLLRIVVRGGEAAAQLALDGMSEAVPAAVGGE